MSEPHATTALAQATDAAKNGRTAEAESLLNGLLLEFPTDADAHNLYFAIAMQKRDFPLARKRAEDALAHVPDNARGLCNLGSALMQLNDHDGAMAKFDAAIELEPAYFFARRNRGQLHSSQDRFAEAAADFGAAVAAQPNRADTRIAYADALTETRQFKAAAAELQTAAKLGTGPQVEQTYIWGRLMYRMGKFREARQAFAITLSSDASNLKHYQALSAASFHNGDPRHAVAVTRAGIKRFPSAERDPGDPILRVLVLEALGEDCFTTIGRKGLSYSPGNYPAFLPPDRIAYTHVLTDTIDALGDAVDLGKFDLAINNRPVHERILKRGHVERYDRIVAELPMPLINPPSAVAQSTRIENARRFANAEQFIFPRTIHVAHEADMALTRARILDELTLPLILRPLDTQLGIGATLIHNERELEQELAKGAYTEFYAIEYHECGSEDGLFRRYRCASLGGQLAPDNLHISGDWNVHGYKRDALDWYGLGLDREELRYIEDPESVLGIRPEFLFKEISDNTDLDIYGIDFGRRQDGRFVVFEINAAMALTEADLKKFPYRQASQEKAVARFEAYFSAMAAQ